MQNDAPYRPPHYQQYEYKASPSTTHTYPQQTNQLSSQSYRSQLLTYLFDSLSRNNKISPKNNLQHSKAQSLSADLPYYIQITMLFILINKGVVVFPA